VSLREKRVEAPRYRFTGQRGCLVRREEFEIIRSNVLRIKINSEVEKLLKCLQREYKKYFDAPNKFVK